jgi:transposase-like protein
MESVVAVWRERVWRQRRSGWSIAEFCDREDVSQASFYHWRKRLGEARQRSGPSAMHRRQREAANRVRPLFVPVEISTPQVNRGSVRIELPGGALVTLPEQASAELVTTAIRAAMSATIGAAGAAPVAEDA